MSPSETMIYENITDINSCVKVDDLKGYIGRKQINDGLKEEYKSIKYGAQHPTTKSKLKENVVKNRYKTIVPYDHSRVILETDHGSGKSDYINANYIDGFEKDKCYIASQGPTKITISDHWRMIWQKNVKKIVMLTNLEESGKAKCDRYWPVGGKPITYGSLVLTLVTEKERAAYVTREISVMNKKTKEERVVTQHHFTAWPDHGTPDPLYLVLFHRHVTTDHNPTENNPLLVHCSAGIGRTGTYIALDALLEEGRTTGYVNIAKFLMKMRYNRMNMIQTPHQYVCLHYALLEAFTMMDTSIRKEKFNEVWMDIQSDKRPINQQRINVEFEMLEAKKSEHESPEYIAAMSTKNINKKRDPNSVVMDSTRLYLTTFEKGRSNFINAVQVPSYTKFVGYLATQLPLPDTKVDFWTMIRDHTSSTIVLILNDQKKADLVYTATTDSFTCGQFTMKITKRDQGELDITEATLIMSKKDDKPTEITIYQTVCENMPDPNVLCRLVDLISTRISMSPDPVTVVSSDGAKNCGLFCTFTNAVSSMKIDETADIFQLVRFLQLRRPEFFADFEEYRLCYEALNIYLTSSNVYANL